MALTPTPSGTFFGMHVGQWPRHWRAASQRLLALPSLRWLRPAVRVRLRQDGGNATTWTVAHGLATPAPDAHGSAAITAVELPAAMGLRLGLDVLLLTMAVMGGRVIPMFTHNALPHARARRLAWLERIALGALWGLMAIDLMPWQGTGAAIALALVACVHLLRLLLWQPWKTVGTPLLWVLHVGYLWIPVHLALRALHELGLVSAQLATHALTVGAIGGLTIGMMTRTALGHTGRPLRAGNWELGAYLDIFGAALVRVGGPLAWPAAYGATVWLAALLWCVGFSCYLVRYLPILTRPRVDGRPG